MGDQRESVRYRRWLRFPGANRSKGIQRKAVLAAFRQLQERLSRLPPENDDLAELRHTTSALLKAEEAGELRWEQLRTLLVEGIDYVAIFRELGKHTWSAMSETERATGVAMSVDGPSFSWYRTAMFVSYAGWIATFLTTEGANPDQDTRPERQVRADVGPSTPEWLGLTFNGEAMEVDAPVSSKDCPRARVLATNLSLDGVFAVEMKVAQESVSPWFGKKRWYYEYDTNTVYALTADDDLVAWSGRPVPTGVKDDLRELCRHWCFASVSNVLGDIAVRGLSVTVQRPKVTVRPDATGIDLFIPRYYKFNDLHNYAGTDFKPLQTAMRRVFPAGRLQLRQEYNIEFARKRMAGLVRRGAAPSAAWEKTRKELEWSERTMSDYVGARPKAARPGTGG